MRKFSSKKENLSINTIKEYLLKSRYLIKCENFSYLLRRFSLSAELFPLFRRVGETTAVREHVTVPLFVIWSEMEVKACSYPNSGTLLISSSLSSAFKEIKPKKKKNPLKRQKHKNHHKRKRLERSNVLPA